VLNLTAGVQVCYLSSCTHRNSFSCQNLQTIL